LPDDAPVRLILIRHGETEHNRDQITLGRADAPLNDRGRAQAKALAASFTSPPAAIYSSPLVRAFDTAQAIGRATRCAVTVEPELIEMDIGAMEHMTGAELREKHPEFLKQWLADATDARMPGGETLAEVQARAWSAVESIRAQHAEGEVVAVTHNFVILTLVCRTLGLPLRDFRRVRQALAAKTVLDVRDGSATLVQLNDVSHLAAAGIGGGAPLPAPPR
jgi:broad specificity phosphatase PhoE